MHQQHNCFHQVCNWWMCRIVTKILSSEPVIWTDLFEYESAVVSCGQSRFQNGYQGGQFSILRVHKWSLEVPFCVQDGWALHLWRILSCMQRGMPAHKRGQRPEPLLLAWVFYGVEGSLMMWSPQREVFVTFFSCQFIKCSCEFCKIRQERREIANQAQKTSNIGCRVRNQPFLYSVCFTFIGFDAPAWYLMSQEMDFHAE